MMVGLVAASSSALVAGPVIALTVLSAALIGGGIGLRAAAGAGGVGKDAKAALEQCITSFAYDDRPMTETDAVAWYEEAKNTGEAKEAARKAREDAKKKAEQEREAREAAKKEAEKAAKEEAEKAEKRAEQAEKAEQRAEEAAKVEAKKNAQKRWGKLKGGVAAAAYLSASGKDFSASRKLLLSCFKNLANLRTLVYADKAKTGAVDRQRNQARGLQDQFFAALDPQFDAWKAAVGRGKNWLITKVGIWIANIFTEWHTLSEEAAAATMPIFDTFEKFQGIFDAIATDTHGVKVESEEAKDAWAPEKGAGGGRRQLDAAIDHCNQQVSAAHAARGGAKEDLAAALKSAEDLAARRWIFIAAVQGPWEAMVRSCQSVRETGADGKSKLKTSFWRTEIFGKGACACQAAAQGLMQAVLENQNAIKGAE
jgi:hypothetical protein